MTVTTASARWFALISGVTGVTAGILFVLFFALADPFGGGTNRWSWTGPANDAVGTLQMLTLGPAAWGLRGRMPASRTVRGTTVAVVAATSGASVLQILIFLRWVPLADNLVAGAVATYLVFVWILVVSLTGHRTRTLPRRVTRPGLLIGAGFPAGVVLILPALVTPAPARAILLGLGGGIGVLGFLAIPVFPLLLARFVFTDQSVKEKS